MAGTTAGADMAIQEFHVIPATARCYAEALQMGVEIYAALREVILRRYGRDRLFLGPSAGMALPPGTRGDPGDLLAAADAAGYGGQCRLGLDCAASEFYDSAAGRYQFCGKAMESRGDHRPP